MTCSWVPRPIDALLTMSMKEGETLRDYTNRYWELYNEIGRSHSGVATRTFKIGLQVEFELRKSLTKNPAKDMHKLMEQIKKYKRLEDD